MNVLLIGPRASGKTSLGRLLARRLGLPFVDLDDVILQRLGVATAHEAWSAGGEPLWRQAEAAALEATLDTGPVVLALGGGTPMIPDCRRRIERRQAAAAARVVYLECPVKELVRRLRAEPGDRPSLTGSDPADEIGGILAERESTYRALADVVFPAWGEDQAMLAEGLEKAIGTGVNPAG